MPFDFTIINIIADITFKLLNQIIVVESWLTLFLKVSATENSFVD